LRLRRLFVRDCVSGPKKLPAGERVRRGLLPQQVAFSGPEFVQLVIVSSDRPGHGAKIDDLAETGEAPMMVLRKEAIDVVVRDHGAGFEGAECRTVVDQRARQLDFAKVGGVRHALDGRFVIEEAERGTGAEQRPVGEAQRRLPVRN